MSKRVLCRGLLHSGIQTVSPHCTSTARSLTVPVTVHAYGYDDDSSNDDNDVLMAACQAAIAHIIIHVTKALLSTGSSF